MKICLRSSTEISRSELTKLNELVSVVISGAAFCLALVLFGCVTDGGGAERAVHSILTDVKTRVEAVQKAQDELVFAESNRVEHAEKTAHFVADRVDGARYANRQNTPINAYTTVVDTELDHAAHSLPPPSDQSQAQIIQKLQLALSNNEADKARLAATNELLRVEAMALRSETTNLANQASTKELALRTKTVELSKKAEELNDVETKARFQSEALAQQQKITQSERGAKIRTRIAAIFMGFGGLLIVAGIIAAYLHVPGVLLPALAGGASAFAFGFFISWIEQFTDKIWFKIGVGVIVLGGVGLLAWLGYRTAQTRKTAKLDAQISNSTIGAIQELRNDDDRFGTSRFNDVIKPYLEAWHTTPDGFPHPDVQREIDRRLVKMNLRDAGKKTATVVRLRPPAATTASSTPDAPRRTQTVTNPGMATAPLETKPPTPPTPPTVGI
jgi:hypothetical protein